MPGGMIVVISGGNITKTADHVGMERSALHRKLKLLGVQTSERNTVYDA
jgi:two-component system nitrogen regulation response regulator NtrX